MRQSLVVIVLLAASAGAVPGPASAQVAAPDLPPRLHARPAVEYFVARNRLERGGGAASELAGVGGRVLWPLAGGAAHPLLSRVAVGGYLVHSAEAGEEPDMWHYGVQADLRLARSPLAGLVDPLVSLGLGAVRVEEPVQASLLTPVLAPRGGAPDVRARTDPSLVPGLGARVHLLPGVGFRGDARLVVDFRDGTSRSLELAGGISLTT